MACLHGRAFGAAKDDGQPKRPSFCSRDLEDDTQDGVSSGAWLPAPVHLLRRSAGEHAARLSSHSSPVNSASLEIRSDRYASRRSLWARYTTLVAYGNKFGP